MASATSPSACWRSAVWLRAGDVGGASFRVHGRRRRGTRAQLSVGAAAVSSIAIGAVAVGFTYAVGAIAFGPAAIDTLPCYEAALGFARQWLPQLPRICR